MNFNNHSILKGKHAVLSPSNPSWLNYSYENFDEKLNSKYRAVFAQDIGTLLHEYAEKRITHKLKVFNNKSERNAVLLYLLDNGIPRNVINIEAIFTNLMNYINDAIGFGMEAEVILYYSDVCFGTADTISFRKNKLRIHDYKSGIVPAHMEQLEIYAGLFLLEYSIKPSDIETELRLYQNDEVLYSNPTAEDLLPIMDRIATASEYLMKLKEEA